MISSCGLALTTALAVLTAGHPLKESIPAGSTDPAELLSTVIEAIGGFESLQQVRSFSYNASTIYRSQTLTQNYNLYHSDQSVSDAGTQLMSFSISETGLQERIDRFYNYNEYWIWALPDLQPSINFTVVVRDGADGYACFNRGQNTFFNNVTQALGYADPYLTDYLINQAHQFALPWLLQRFQMDVSKIMASSVSDSATLETLKTLTHPDLGLTILVDNNNSMPYLIRTHEDHAIFGPSTSDLLLSDYAEVQLDANSSIMLPHRFQTVYNGVNVIEDFIVDELTLNPTFPSAYFKPLPENESSTPRSAPAQSADYPRSEVHQFFESGLWAGPFGEEFNSTSNVISSYPVPGNDKIRAISIGYADYVQLLVEFEDGLLITDAPAHRAQIIMEWAQEHLGKKITHVVPSHHHHDHSSGIADYVNAGITVVVPEMAKDYYKDVSNGTAKFITYTAEKPFVLKDDTVQFRSMWMDENPHAKDWTYALATSACPSADDGVAIFIADLISPGLGSTRWESGFARQWLLNAIQDGLPRSTVIVGAHGSTMGGNSTQAPLTDMTAQIGFNYPALTNADWKAGGPLC